MPEQLYETRKDIHYPTIVSASSNEPLNFDDHGLYMTSVDDKCTAVMRLRLQPPYPRDPPASDEVAYR